MKQRIVSVLSFSIAISLTSCALQPQVWENYERSGLGKVDTRSDNRPPSRNTVERLISVPLDPIQQSTKKFDLYYFVRMPATGKATKTILYCAGGPGEIVQGPTVGTTAADFLTENGYNVVYFHQRGAGYSQIPASNRYDHFLRTSFVVEDLEAIRRDFLGEHGKWDGIIGWSYGTVVAQEYTRIHRNSVDRLILIGPMSRDKFKSSADVFDEIVKEIRRTDRETLINIYGLPAFADLSTDQKNLIVDTVFGGITTSGVFDQTEEAFGSIAFVIDSYCELRNKNELKNYNLDTYSQRFFKALRDLQMFGWHPKDEFSTDDQVRIGHRIKEEILYHHTLDDCSTAEGHDSPGLSNRTQYVTRTYDGINMPFLREWLRNGKNYVLDALKRSGGEANNLRNVNKYLGKIGIADTEAIEPWDPGQYKHDVPTLILKGTADTVTAGGAAEYFFREGLSGDGTLIKFPGVGHALISETISFPENVLSGTVQIDQLSMASGETRQVLGTYKGRTLNENFRVELKTDDLPTDLKLAGFGLVKKNQTGLLDIVALIENTGNQTMTVPSKWKINSRLFQATVSLDAQPINRGDKKEVRGQIKAAWGNTAIRVEKPNDLGPNLDYLCAHVRSEPDPTDPTGNTLQRLFEIWIQNNSMDPAAGAFDGPAKSWSVANSTISSTFSVDPDPIKSQEVSNTLFAVEAPFLSDLNLQEEAKISLNPANNLLGCVQEQDENISAIAVYNPEATDVPAGPEKLTIDNAIFTRTYDVNLPEISSFQSSVIRPTNPEYNWKLDIPVIGRASNVDPGLELRGWYVAGQDQISMLLRNNSQHPIESTAAEWVYIDPNDGGACRESNMSRNCLIYSFLVMSPKAFKNPSDNQILQIIKDSGGIICYRGPEGIESSSQTADCS